MRGEPTELACPFCDKGKIQCHYIAGVFQEKRHVTATFGARKERKKSSDIWLIQSGCSICGKTLEEVEKELRRKNII